MFWSEHYCVRTRLQRRHPLVRNVSQAVLNFIFHEVKRADKIGSDSSKYECTLGKTYGLPCACLISKNLNLEKTIHMDETFNH